MPEEKVRLFRLLSGTRTGNALSEYGLIAGLAIVVCISGLVTLSKNIDTNLSVFDNNGSTASNGQKTQVFQLTAPPTPQATPVATGNVLASASIGQAMPPEKVSTTAVANLIQTIGSNGATDVLASAMDSYVMQLQASGALSPDQLNTLQKLSNAGHELAKAQTILKDALSKGQTTLTYNGATYNTDDFKWQLGVNNNSTNAGRDLDATQAQTFMAPFMNLYADAKANGSLTDPNVYNTITYLAQNIVVVTNNYKWNTDNTDVNTRMGYQTAVGTQITATYTPVVPLTADPATIVHSDSSDICSVGNGSDNGVQCH
jgi:Flp pilus assembly pilin Flp